VLDFFFNPTESIGFLSNVSLKINYFLKMIIFLVFLSAEIDLHTKCVVDVDANKVILNPVNTNLSKGDAR
jgi:hypothetical protein